MIVLIAEDERQPAGLGCALTPDCREPALIVCNALGRFLDHGKPFKNPCAPALRLRSVRPDANHHVVARDDGPKRPHGAIHEAAIAVGQC